MKNTFLDLELSEKKRDIVLSIEKRDIKLSIEKRDNLLFGIRIWPEVLEEFPSVTSRSLGPWKDGAWPRVET